MPIKLPTLRQLVDRALADIDARVKDANARLHASNFNVLGIVLAGAIDGLYRYLGWIQRQMFVKTCDEEQLQIRAEEWQVPRKPASAATGVVKFSAIPGSLIAEQSLLIRSDGVRYMATSNAGESGGFILVAVQAVEPGTAGNAVLSTPINLLTPVAGVQSAGEVQTAISGGAEIEDIERWRERILRRMSRAPQGGTISDYEDWALEVPGVTRVWVSPHEAEVGTITLRFVRDNDDPIIPDSGELLAVKNHIEPLRPVAVSQLYIVAPVPVPLNFSLTIDPATPDVKANVEAALKSLIHREAVPGGTLLLSHIEEAISTAIGEYDHTLMSPNSNVVTAIGELTVMGAISWI